jgi:hypothetical protein
MHVDLFLKENIYYLCCRQGAGQENNVSDGGRGSCVFSGDFIAEKKKENELIQPVWPFLMCQQLQGHFREVRFSMPFG